MKQKRKLPAVPKIVPIKYHHEIKCVMQDFQNNILSDILKYADLTDDEFLKIIPFTDCANIPLGVLEMIKDIKGNAISKRLYKIKKEQLK